MQVNVLFQFLFFWSFLCSTCIGEGSYAGRVTELFQRHFGTEKNGCWQAAKTTANTFEFDKDKTMAIALVNVYTQECKSFKNNTENASWYKELNRNLRERTNKAIWLDTQNLLNEGLKMLNFRNSWPLLYRACHCPNIGKGDIVPVYPFWSTTLKASVANGYLNDSIFFKIVDSPPGAAISDYSASPHEKEVILQSNIELYVLEYADNKTGIDAMQRGVNEKVEWNSMKAFALMTGKIPERARRSASKLGNCDCSGRTTSAASMPTSFLSALAFLAFRLVW